MRTKKLCAGLLLALALGLAASAQAQTAAVTRGNLEKTVFGQGEILPLSQPGVYAQITGEVAACAVGVGDTVAAGDLLMMLENDELAAEVAQMEHDIQLAQDDVLRTETHTQYEYRQLYDKDGERRYDVNTGEPLLGKYSNEISIRAPSAGRIMAVYIEPGDDALAVYREHGCVVMLSTDGRMKVELEGIEGVTLSLDETVRIAGDGFETEGHVVSLTRRGTQATIQVMSDEYPMDAPVTVTTLAGEPVGSGLLAINKPMAVSAYGGTIKGLYWNIKVGSYLKRDDVIARLEWDDIPLYIDNDLVLHAYAKQKAELEAAMQKQERLAVLSPVSGVVASVEAEPGDSVEDGTLLLSIVEDAGMTLTLKVDELDIVRVTPGQNVRLSVDALSETTLTGVVEKIAPLGNTQSSVTTYDVTVSLTGEADSRLRSGMNVSGEIVVETAKDALLIPTDALQKGADGWQVTLESGQTRRVELGIMTDEKTQVLSGLSLGEYVVY
ncbi:MAG: HlyD family efflux transporter periplasmic adaptor subunit [Candidatus Ventricola sp.]